MSTVVILVIDGFGVGAMPDAGEPRPGDVAADTCGHVLDHHRAHGRPLRLPALAALGLGLVHPDADLDGRASLPSAVGRAALGYPGADSYAGHQTMMGADFSTVTAARLGDHLDRVAAALRAAGHEAAPLDDLPLLLVDRCVLVHDSLEADPGVNWNVSGRLEDASFDRILAIARTVRTVAPVARVIAVGGHADKPVTAYVRGGGGVIGFDTPESGFYANGGLRVEHLGVPLDHTQQLPSLAAHAGIPVTLIGKAADIIAGETAVRRPAVPTDDVLAHTLDSVRAGSDALIVANAQETDLAGHQQDAAAYGRLLELIDRGIADLLPRLDTPSDRLIVTGDHGNDPTIGHPFHTREYAPILIHRPEAPAAIHLPDATSLADIAATAAACLGLEPTSLEAGTPCAR